MLAQAKKKAVASHQAQIEEAVSALHEVASQLTAQVRLLCEMLQVRSVEALVPAAEQLLGRAARMA